MAGYSTTPLARKLGIREGSEVPLLDAPENLAELLEPLPDSVRFVSRLTASTNLIHGFFTCRNEMEEALARFRAEMDPAAGIWVSWPKKASKVPTDITENTIREIALPMGLVDVKVCVVNEVWSGLKLVIRKEFR